MHLLEDIQAYKKNDPAARSAVEVILLYNGLHATIDYRIAHWFYRHRLFFIARAISQWSKMWTGIEIHPGATIGRRLVIDHGTGIVIGETAEIGDDCLLYQGVTLGGTGKESGKRHPTLGNNVMVGVNAAVLGSITIHDNSKVGGGAVVVEDVPENCTVVGVPARVVVRNGKLVQQEEKNAAARRECLPDPTTADVVELQARVARLETLLAAQAQGKTIGSPAKTTPDVASDSE